MFQRFVAGSAVAAVLVAVAAVVLVSVAGSALPRMWPLATMWCFVPLAWGIWALLTPKTWMPNWLPYWGAILGLIGGIMSAFVLNIPSRVFAMTVTMTGRTVAVLAVVVLYYFLWMLVRTAYMSLVPPQQPVGRMPDVMKKAA